MTVTTTPPATGENAATLGPPACAEFGRQLLALYDDGRLWATQRDELAELLWAGPLEVWRCQ